MLCPPGWRALPWATLLLLLSLQPQVSYTWCSEEDLRSDQQQGSNPELSAAVRLALAMFNQQSKEENVYRLERILNFQLKTVESPGRVLSTQLLLRRTVCRKSERNTDSCPFYPSLEPRSTFNCSFTIRSQHQEAQLSILRKTCSIVHPSQ
ncbi:cystatin-9-like [Octodon degus]|uniref:Cystatin-9-like n=1 Tax=Octodon degus TaxID=10160 RepID=A0A6P3VBK6_OCTDE|nr:cystatin-9-like [Octodon degus]